MCQSLFFNKVAGLRPATLLKKEALAQVFSCEFCEISKNTFLQITSGRLRLFLINFIRGVVTAFACTVYNLCRSSHLKCFIKKGVLKYFAKIYGKTLVPESLLKKRLCHRCFPMNFAKFLRPPFLTEHLQWLLLKDGKL